MPQAIISGLRNASILRLKSTWALLSKSILKAFYDLQALFSEQRNYAKLQEHIAPLSSPLIPFLPIHLDKLAAAAGERISSPFRKQDLISSIQCCQTFFLAPTS